MNHYLNQDISIQNAITGKQYQLVPLHKIEVSQKNLKDISVICNEDLVYQWCFKKLCEGKPYPIELALDWLTWGTNGWQNDTHYVYAITDMNGSIAAAVDIKNSNRQRSEMGYWSSRMHRGIMTNAVQELCKIADNAGFKTLFADIHPKNKRSLAVIRRCGFEEVNRRPTIEGHISHDRNPPKSE